MRRSILAVGFCGLLVTACVQPANAALQSGSGDQPFTWSGTMHPGAVLTVRNFNGRVDVRAGLGDRVEVRAEHDDKDLTFQALTEGGDVSICSVWRGHSACDRNRGDDWNDDDRDGHDMRATITITLPKGVSLRGGTGNGDVTVDGTGGDISIATGNGRVRVSGTAGTVKASSGNGDLDVTGARGTVSASTGNGRVHVTTDAGPVTATTGNGDITVDMHAVSSADDMKFSTGHGDVTVSLPSNINADFDASTGSGSINTDFPVRVQGSMNPRHIRGTIGRGGMRIHISSGSGSIDLRKAN